MVFYQDGLCWCAYEFHPRVRLQGVDLEPETRKMQPEVVMGGLTRSQSQPMCTVAGPSSTVSQTGRSRGNLP